MGMPAEANSRTACAVTCTLPKSETCDVSINLTFCKVVCRDLTVSSSPLLPSVAPCSLTYSGRASSRAGISRRTVKAGCPEPPRGYPAGSPAGPYSSRSAVMPTSPLPSGEGPGVRRRRAGEAVRLECSPLPPGEGPGVRACSSLPTSCSPRPAPRSSRLCSKWVSSGRQMPTSEQRGHLGLSTRGGGMTPPAAVARSCSSSSRVRSTSGSSKGMETRLRESM